jgi:hypothetical protein
MIEKSFHIMETRYGEKKMALKCCNITQMRIIKEKICLLRAC